MSDNPDERDNPYERAGPEPDPPAGPEPDATAGPEPDAAVQPEPDAGPTTAVTSTFDVREAERSHPAGAHQAERPVPRSGLAEHNSAGYLTGERLPLRQDPDLTQPVPAAPDGDAPAPWLAGAGAGAGAAGAGAATAEPGARPRTDRDVLLDGTTALRRPPSRAGAHVWTVVLTLLFAPVAWYLLADAGARLTLPQDSPWETGDLNVAALLELAGGLVVLAVVLIAARWSSVGVIVTGAVGIVAGLPFVAVPDWTQQLLEPVTDWLRDLGDFGGNVAHHLVATGSTGRLLGYGVALVLVGVVSHGARRQGRREVQTVRPDPQV